MPRADDRKGPGPEREAELPRGSAGEALGPDPSVVIIPEVNTAIVSRGENLWRISRRVYGQGIRYTMIFGANKEQIRDPDLIYPGQVFVLPTGEARGLP